MTSRILVAGIGNIFLCDDGFGVEVARRLAGTDLPDGVTVTDYGIRGMHLAYDLASGFDAAILVDAAGRGGTEPAAGPDAHPLLDAHGMQPDVVLGMLDLLGGTRPGQIIIVGCEPACVEEGMGLSEPVAAAVDEAARLVLELVTEGPGAWARRRQPAGHGTRSHGAARPGGTDPDAGAVSRGAFDHGAQQHAAPRRGRLFAKGWRHVPRHSR
jgi:hydrogenase maturation protease